MESRLIEIFVASARFVFESIGGSPLTVGAVERAAAHRAAGDVVTMVSLDGDGVTGNLLLGVETPAACALAESFLGEAHTTLTDEVRSLVGEITNMVCGAAKRGLGEIGIAVGMARPEFLGPDRAAPLPVDSSGVVVLPFELAGGRIVVSVDLAVQPGRS